MARSSILVLTTFLIGSSTASAQPFFDFFEPVTPARPAQVMVHRGMAIAAPENSAAAIKMCIDDYCEWVEIDVRLSKDGRHVIIHDATVDSTTNGKGAVSDLTLDELKALDAGSWFAERFAGAKLLTLAEALSLAKDKINLCLDCKQVNPKLIAEEVVAAGMQRQVVVYGSQEVLRQIKAASNGTVAVLADYRPQIDLDAFLKDVAPAAVELQAKDISADLCRRFHTAGVKVEAQLLGPESDKPDVWARVVDAGADWLQTDHPAAILYFNARRRIGKFPVMISLHRGANRYAPENTIPAIEETARLGIDFVEIDIRTTKDGNTVLMHDNTVNRTTTAKGSVRELLFDQVVTLSAGTWFGKPYRETRVPSFEDGLAVFGPRMGGYLDAKDIAPEALIEMIRKHGLTERHVVYQSLQKCAALRKVDPTVRIMPPLRRLEGLDQVAAIQPYAVDAAWENLSKEMIDECHRRNILVFSDCFGANETIEQYRKAIDWKIDCIQVDQPLRILRAIEMIADPQRGNLRN